MRIFMLASSPSTLVNFRGCLIEALLGMDHEVHVAAPDITEDMVTCKWLNQRGVVIHNVPMSRTGLNVFADLETFFGFYRLMRTTKPNLVFAYTVKPVVWGVIAAWLAKVPKRVALITGLGYAFIGEAKGKRALVRWIVSALYGLALRAATLVIFQNPDDRNDFRRWGILPSKRASVLVNGSGVDTAAFPLSPLPEMPPKFLLVARLLKDKGVREYVHAATIVRQTYPNATFDIVGPIDSIHFETVIDGMYDVFENGTAKAVRLEHISQCGKTGTAQNPHGQDHSIFVSFAPKDDPKIAIAVIIENGYWGSRWAAPISSLMTELYLSDTITRPRLEQRMLEGELHEEYRKQHLAIYGEDSTYEANF